MLFDSLTHVTPDGKWFHTDYDASEARLIREMDEAGVEKAVLVGLAGYISNDFILEVCSRYSGRLIPCGSFDPSIYLTKEDAVQAIRNELKENEFQLVKFHPRFNGYDPLDPRCLAVFNELSSWEKPLHIWLDTMFYNKNIRLRKPLVDTIHEIVTSYYDLTFILLHGGGSWCYHVAEAIRDCQNCYMDLSWTLCNYYDSSILNDIFSIARRFDKKLLFGSDFPEVSIKKAFKKMRDLIGNLELEKVNRIMGENLNSIMEINK